MFKNNRHNQHYIAQVEQKLMCAEKTGGFNLVN